MNSSGNLILPESSSLLPPAPACSARSSGYLWGHEKELCAPGSPCRWEADLLGAHVTSFEAAMGRGALIFAVVGLVGAALYAIYAWITKPTT
jgi:hypothetical protein